MIIASALFSQLSQNAAVAAMVGNRIYPAQSPEIGKLYPCVVYSGDAAEEDINYDGPSGLVFQTLKIACLANTGDATGYDAATALAKAVRQALDDGKGNWGGVSIQGCYYETETESTEADESSGQSSLVYIVEQTYWIAFNQPA